MYLKTTLAAAALALTGAAASAATISVQQFSAAAYAAYTGSVDVLASEDFEGFPAEVQGDLPVTSVGAFASLGPTGTGSSVVGDGTELAVRDGSTVSGFGRVNTTQTVGAKNWLDSNDTLGIEWMASLGGASFRQLAFSLSDAADQGAELSVAADGSVLTTFVGQGNGTVDWIVITFGGNVSSATITLENNDRLDDGFGIDDATIAAIPLPAGLLLLGTALGGLGLARRRKTA